MLFLFAFHWLLKIESTCFHISVYLRTVFLVVCLLIGWFILVFRHLSSLYIVNINPLLGVQLATLPSFCSLPLHSGNYLLCCTDPSDLTTTLLVNASWSPGVLSRKSFHFILMVSSSMVSGLTLRFVHWHLHWARERGLMSFSIYDYLVFPVTFIEEAVFFIQCIFWYPCKQQQKQQQQTGGCISVGLYQGLLVYHNGQHLFSCLCHAVL